MAGSSAAAAKLRQCLARLRNLSGSLSIVCKTLKCLPRCFCFGVIAPQSGKRLWEVPADPERALKIAVQ